MTQSYNDEMRGNEEILLQIRDLKKQMNELEAKLDCIVTNQAIIIGVLNGTIDISPLCQPNTEKMH